MQIISVKLKRFREKIFFVTEETFIGLYVSQGPTREKENEIQCHAYYKAITCLVQK